MITETRRPDRRTLRSVPDSAGCSWIRRRPPGERPHYCASCQWQGPRKEHETHDKGADLVGLLGVTY